MDQRWFFVALATLILWGVWGVVTRVASSSLGWRETTAIAAVGNMLAAVIFILVSGASLAPRGFPWLLALAAGALGFTGALTFYIALNLNPSSIVIVSTSLYPLVTIAISVILLGETFTLRQALGAVLAIAALILISAD